MLPRISSDCAKAMNHPVPHEPPVPESADTGLPLFRTWRGIYILVLGCFVGFVIVLAIFTSVFS